MSNERPQVTVYSAKGEKVKQVPLPDVFTAPIRQDIVQNIVKLQKLNGRQSYARNKYAGMQTAAESWGTGRAVSRIPRVPGGGTHRAGQGAFGNMCRGGRMFSVLRTWRRWAHKVNTHQKRLAVVSAISGSAEPCLVESHGHVVDNVNEFPIVVSDEVQSMKKATDAKKVLESLGLAEELAKVNKSRTMRAGKGKYRNRRYKMKKGPLVVYAKDEGVKSSFRKLRGVETCQVNNLSVLNLAPGSRVGRLVVWTESALLQLNKNWGTYGKKSVQSNKSRTQGVYGRKFKLPMEVLTNSDINSIINSDEVKAVVRDQRLPLNVPKYSNALKHTKTMDRLNPFAAELRKKKSKK